MEQNQRLEITPRAMITGNRYGGYVSASGLNVTGGSVSVEVVQTTNVADLPATIFSIEIDGNNWYRFVEVQGQLYFQDKIAGVKNSANVAYVPAQHRFWRFRHDSALDTINFETSGNGTTWISRRSVPRTISITSIKIELSAGTFNWVDSPGTAIFDNLVLTPGQPLARNLVPVITLPELFPSVDMSGGWQESKTSPSGQCREGQPIGCATYRLSFSDGRSFDIPITEVTATPDVGGFSNPGITTNMFKRARADL